MNNRIVKLIVGVFLLMTIVTFSGCNSNEVVAISINEEFYLGDEIANYQIKLEYNDNTSKEVALSKAISSEDLEKLSTLGTHSITINYEGYTKDVTIVVKEKPLALSQKYRISSNMIECEIGGTWLEVVSVVNIASFQSEEFHIDKIEINTDNDLIITFSDLSTLNIGKMPNVVEYIVALDPNGGSFLESDEVLTVYVYEGAYASLVAPTREDYIFKGWFIEDGIEITEDYPIYEDLHAYARWEKAAPIDLVVSDIPSQILEDGALPTRSGITYTYKDPSYAPYDLEKNCFINVPSLGYDPVIIIVDNVLEQIEVTVNFGYALENEKVVNSESYTSWSGYSIINNDLKHYINTNNVLSITTSDVTNNHLNERVFDSSIKNNDFLYCNQTDDTVSLELAQVAYSQSSGHSSIIFKANGEIKETYSSVSILTTITLDAGEYLWCPGNTTNANFKNLTAGKLNSQQKIVFSEESDAIKEEKISLSIENIKRLYENNVYDGSVALPIAVSSYGTSISWFSTNEDIVDSLGDLGDFFGVRKVVFNIEVSYKGFSERTTITIKAQGKPMKDISENVVAGYVYYGTGASLSDELLETLDVIYFAFGNVGTDHKAYLNQTAQAALRTVLSKAHSKGVRVVLSLGENSNLFSDAAFTADSRKTFALSILDLLDEYELDGIDIDWELPGLNSGRTTAVDRPNYTLLIEAIYNTIKPVNNDYIISAAVPGGRWGYTRFELPKLVKYFDFLNLMTYDMQEGYGASHHTALYQSSMTATSASADGSIKIYTDNGFPLNKLIIGAAFYGRYKMESGEMIGQNIQYSQIKTRYLNNLSDTIKRMWDDVAKAPYITVNGEFTITYDDPESIKEKCKYVAEKGIRGIMYWDNGSDNTGELIQALHESLGVMKK